MNHIKDILSTSPVFSALGEDDIQGLETLFDKRDICPGDILANAGETAQYFFLLNSGTLLLAMDKGKSVVLNMPGDFIGMELLSDKELYKTTLTVLEKGSVSAISRQDFMAVIREDSAAASVIMASWQEYLDRTAPFAKNIEDLVLPEIF
jgi:CRP-like cAMP-binding protein